MKRLFLSLLLALFAANYGFSEFQIDSNFGWFFERNTYTDESVSRSINGPMLGVIIRYFPLTHFGIFAGFDSDVTIAANNDEYLSLFTEEGMDATVDMELGDKINLKFGASLAFPVNNKLSIQSDIGILYTVWGIEAITGTISYQGYKFDAGIFPKINNWGVLGSVFGSYLVSEKFNTYITFGMRLNYLFWRKEKTEVIINGVSNIVSGEPSFYGLGIAPFIGLMGKY
jgi:hypothetical protein